MRLLGDTLRVDHVTWHSPLPVDVAEQRLRSTGLTGFGSLVRFRGAPLSGRIHSERVSAMKRTSANNAWFPVFVGSLASDLGGSRLAGEIRGRRPTQVFMVLWCAAALVGSVFALMKGVTDQPTALLGLLFPVFGVVLCNAGSALAAGHWGFLRATLGDAIDGIEVPHERQPT